MNKELESLYESKWNELSIAVKDINNDSLREIKPANPLLINIDNEEEYMNADLRIMIFGQETNDWHQKFNLDKKITLDGYRSFFERQFGTNIYPGQYWNGFRKFRKMILEDKPKLQIGFLWNNIVKIGKLGSKGFPPDYIYEIERKHFSVVKEEIEITKPNVILFLTGPDYDEVIADNFGHLTYKRISPFTVRQLSKLEMNDVQFAFRTYHPNYLWRNNISKYFSAIIKAIDL
ncbi:MAG: hypothetical protein IPO83_14550 [Chitinophagaceae bacterium]|nr:hypothetical protein [Chitinophagaceae bacterium]